MKKLMLLIFITILLIGIVNAFEFDNVKSYEKDTQTITVKNSFLGLPLDKVAEIKLNTPINNIVPRGYQKIAEFDLILYDDYVEAFKEMEFYDVNNNNEKFVRSFDYKVLSYETILVNDYKNIFVGNSGNGTEIYESQVVGTHERLREKWIKLDITNFNENDNLTIGIFTNVEKGDNIEWIPNFFGVRINE
ncbi:hypothetical protein LCGC14_2122600, partial [marine sediment metagenome]